jgi:cation/acetate symporter
MIYETSWTAVSIFAFFVAIVLGLSFYLGSTAKTSQGYFAAHGQVHWLVNGVAFAGDYLSAASFLGICGMIAFGGYDGFLYSIGYLAGWIVALFVIAEPLKRLGKYTFADALDNKFHSRGIKLAAAISTLVVSTFYLIPQMVGAGALVRPLLGLPHSVGVVTVGVVVIFIVVTAGMVSTTWVQFIKGTLLVVFCFGLTIAILLRGLSADPLHASSGMIPYLEIDEPTEAALASADQSIVPATGVWKDLPYVRIREDKTGVVHIWRKTSAGRIAAAQYLKLQNGERIVNGYPQGKVDPNRETGAPQTMDFYPVGQIKKLPASAIQSGQETGPLDPLKFFAVLEESEIVVWQKEKEIKEEDGTRFTIYYPRVRSGEDLLTPGSSSTFAEVRQPEFLKKLNFLSLMLALFCGTASLPHILIRYYTVKDQASARKSTVVGIASIGFFYVLTLYLGLAAMTAGVLDPTDSNMAAPLLARSFGELPFAFVSAIAFTTVLGTVSGLILAASGAVAHDLASNLFGWQLNDHEKVRVAKVAAVCVGVIAIGLGILFGKLNVNFLVGWAFSIAASANLPSLVMLLFWKGTTKQGITTAIFVGMISSLGWILLSEQAFRDVYGLPGQHLVPFSQPAILTIPLGFAVLVVVSLLTKQAK